MVSILSGVNLEKRRRSFAREKANSLHTNEGSVLSACPTARGNYITCRKNYNLLFLLFPSYLLRNTFDRAVSF